MSLSQKGLPFEEKRVRPKPFHPLVVEISPRTQCGTSRLIVGVQTDLHRTSFQTRQAPTRTVSPRTSGSQIIHLTNQADQTRPASKACGLTICVKPIVIRLMGTPLSVSVPQPIWAPIRNWLGR